MSSSAAQVLGAGLVLTAAWVSPSHAVELGPFDLTGFAKAELQRGSNHCNNCQRYPGEDKQRLWADELVPGRPYGSETTHLVLFQPYLGTKFDLGKGFKVSGLLSQRWRDGKLDIPGFWYEKNVSLSHEDWGRLSYGAMPTRAWSVADYPYGSNLGVSDAWAASGAGYGLLKEALRYTSRTLDVAEGDLVWEVTYDRGNTRFTQHKPSFLEFYAQYRRADWVFEAMYQDTRNGNPQAWGHGPFWAPTANPADDALIGGAGQSIAMLMARYPLNNRWEVSGGVRRNRWSGAYAVITQDATATQGALWNNMFNVNWNGILNGVHNPGYAATSVDWMLGAQYRSGPWTAYTGMVYLGRAQTNNPSERGQSNAALINTAGVSYDYGQGWSAYGFAGMVHYRQLGLSPMSMPTNSAFTQVDSRVTRHGNWLGAGLVYTF